MNVTAYRSERGQQQLLFFPFCAFFAVGPCGAASAGARLRFIEIDDRVLARNRFLFRTRESERSKK